MATHVKVSLLCLAPMLFAGCASSGDDPAQAPLPDARIPVQDRGLPPPPLPDAQIIEANDAALPDPDAALPDADLPVGDCVEGETRPCYEGPEGTEGVGACAAGVETCADGAWGRCEGQVRPAQVDACDGTDEDCNGFVDDSPGVGAPCTLGQNTCATEGARVCDPETGGLRCDAPEPKEPEPETCDGSDEDCDGEIDEGFALGTPCVVGAGGCAQQGEVVCGLGGVPTCSAEAVPEGEEICDGGDNDCDGVIDEEPDDVGEPCEVEGAAGACVHGVTRCVEGAPVCAGATPAEEICNDVDDDCDGVIDEGEGGEPLLEACYEGPEGTADVGACQSGSRACDAGVWGPCEDQLFPAEEICNRVDDDCDGLIDTLANGEACQCQPGEEQACYSGPAGTAGWGQCRLGTQRCLEGGQGFTPCEGEVLPGEEVCGGTDEDCDGNTDEVPGAGEPCEAGVGACYRAGELECGVDGELTCSVIAGEPADGEQCNGEDDDCDGTTDEDPQDVGGACEAGRGECATPGVFTCVAGGLFCPAVPGDPGEEICDDGLDGDCDGAVDEGCGGVALRCDDPREIPNTVGIHFLAGSNAEATDDHEGTCTRREGGKDVLFGLSLEHLRYVRAQTIAPQLGQYDTVVYARATCDEPATELACDDDGGDGLLSRIEGLVEPGDIAIIVDAYNAAADGEYTLQVEIDPHNTCDGAIDLGALGADPLLARGDTRGNTDNGQPGCGFSALSPDHVYTFELDTPGAVVLETVPEPGGHDTVIHLRSTCDDEETELGCSDDDGEGVLSRIQTELEAGRYYIFVDGYGFGGGGPYQLSIRRQ